MQFITLVKLKTANNFPLRIRGIIVKSLQKMSLDDSQKAKSLSQNIHLLQTIRFS